MACKYFAERYPTISPKLGQDLFNYFLPIALEGLSIFFISQQNVNQDIQWDTFQMNPIQVTFNYLGVVQAWGNIQSSQLTTCHIKMLLTFFNMKDTSGKCNARTGMDV